MVTLLNGAVHSYLLVRAACGTDRTTDTQFEFQEGFSDFQFERFIMIYIL